MRFLSYLFNRRAHFLGITALLLLLAGPGLAWAAAPAAGPAWQLDNTPGVSVQPTSGLETTESGGSDTFTVVLNTAPDNPVTVNFTSSNTAEGMVSPDQVTFNGNTWNRPQTITVTGVDDSIVDGDVPYQINLQITTRDDNYRSVPLPTITVTNLDNDVTLPDPPTAVADAYGINQNTSLTVAAPGVLQNDQNPAGNPPMTASLVQTVSSGSLVLNENGSFQYTPNQGFSGQDSFLYRAVSGELVSNTVSVTINVQATNRPPVANPDAYSLDMNTTLQVNTTNGVLSNDSDPDNQPLTAILVAQPANGVLTFNSNGSFTYVPQTNYSGTDQFTYKTSDGQLESNTTTVTLTIRAVNRPPVASSDSYGVDMNAPLQVSAAVGVLSNDSDPDGDSLTAVLVSSPSNGALAFNPDGSFTYTPVTDYTGPDQFTYKASDGQLESNIATVSITVRLVSPPPVANPDSYLTNRPLVVDAANGLLKNDTDPNGANLTVDSFTQPANGSVQVNTNGAFTYTPNSGFDGLDTFTYRASNGQATSQPATVTIRVDITPPPPANWISPVPNGQIGQYEEGVITLEVQPSAPVSDLARVVFLRWDPEMQQRVEIASVPGAPYRVHIQASSLRPGWNQIDAALVDQAGNVSDYQHIWLVYQLSMFTESVYLPLIQSP